MYLTSPDHIPKLPDVPGTLAIHDFLFQDDHGRHPTETSKPPFMCAITGRSFSVLEVKERIEFLASALSVQLGWQVNEGAEMDKAVGIFSLNTVAITASSQLLTRHWALINLLDRYIDCILGGTSSQRCVLPKQSLAYRRLPCSAT